MSGQSWRNHAEWYESIALMEFGDRQSEWTREIFGLFGITGEQILAAIEAAVGKALCREVGLTAMGITLSRSRRSLRFFAEGQANTLVVAGHMIANMAVRTLALDRAFQEQSPGIAAVL